MADDFSQSLTPPVSPFAAGSLCELAPARPPCFCCSDTTGALSQDGYITRGSLKRYSYRNMWRSAVLSPLCVKAIVPIRTVIYPRNTNASNHLYLNELATEVTKDLQYLIWRCPFYRLLLHLDPAPADYDTDTVEIFGFPWVTETALVESTKLLFRLFRYQHGK